MLDAATLSHVVFWIIGAIGVIGTVTAVGALCVLGRQNSYDK